jgi:sugar/nucleoside kinase (ribokinase family)
VRCDAATATTIALVSADGRRAFLHRPGASAVAFPAPPVLPADTIADVGHLHVANPYGVPNLRRQAALLLRDARAAGMTTSLDTGWDSRGEWMQVLAPCLDQLDLLFANEQEALLLTGSSEYAEAGRQLLSEGAGTVVVKLGGAGCAVFTAEDEFVEPAFEVAAIDSTGAGDCFAAGFLAALHQGAGWREAAGFANAVGALNVRHLGATSGLRGYQETREWAANAPRR